jgi:ferrochelatase
MDFSVHSPLPFVENGTLDPNASRSSIHSGDLDLLLSAYDRERLTVPSPIDLWQWGWTKSAETWNGRLAMIAIIAIFGFEVVTGKGVLRHLFDLAPGVASTSL